MEPNKRPFPRAHATRETITTSPVEELNDYRAAAATTTTKNHAHRLETKSRKKSWLTIAETANASSVEYPHTRFATAPVVINFNHRKGLVPKLTMPTPLTQSS